MVRVDKETLGSFVRRKRRRELYHLYEHVLSKPRLILDEMCRLYGKFASLLKTRLIFPRINGPTVLSLNTNTEKIKVLFIYLKPPSSKILIKISLPTYIQGYISEILPSNSSVSVKAPKQLPRNVKRIIED